MARSEKRRPGPTAEGAKRSDAGAQLCDRGRSGPDAATNAAPWATAMDGFDSWPQANLPPRRGEGGIQIFQCGAGAGLAPPRLRRRLPQTGGDDARSVTAPPPSRTTPARGEERRAGRGGGAGGQVPSGRSTATDGDAPARGTTARAVGPASASGLSIRDGFSRCDLLWNLQALAGRAIPRGQPTTPQSQNRGSGARWGGRWAGRCDGLSDSSGEGPLGADHHPPSGGRGGRIESSGCEALARALPGRGWRRRLPRPMGRIAGRVTEPNTRPSGAGKGHVAQCCPTSSWP